MNKEIKFSDRTISKNSPVFIVAEISANHLMDYERTVEIIKAAKYAGADAVKIQTYTADTITINSDSEYFTVNHGSIWDGQRLYDLYKTAYMPWEWQSKLKKETEDLGMVFFSSPFDFTAVDFLEEMNIDLYKVASLEIVDIPLIRKIAKTGKPMLISTGIADLTDIEAALKVCQEEGNTNVILLKCTSTYPAPYEDINLKTIPNMEQTFDSLVGLSDHTMGEMVATAAVALGAKVVEKHLTLRRADGGPDSAFSMEIEEFKSMVESIRNVEAALGSVTYSLTYQQTKTKENARSLFVVQDIKKGESFTNKNIRSIRPGQGLHTKYYEQILEKTARNDIKKGTPLNWDLIN